MRTRAPIQDLRGTDPLTLEIQIGDLVNKPIGALAPANVADLFALSELETQPAGIRHRIKPFPGRMAIELADMPAAAFVAFLEALGACEPSRIPASLRVVLLAETERDGRTEAEKGHVHALAEAWETADPEPFELAGASAGPAVRRAPARAPAEPRKARAPRAAKGDGASGDAPKKPRVRRDMPDEDRAAWIREQVIERLARTRGGALNQPVLIAAIKHRARERFPDMTPKQITVVMTKLLDDGILRRVATRWSLPSQDAW